MGGLPGGLVVPRVGVASVGARCLGQDAEEDRQQEGEEEFHALHRAPEG